MSEINSTKMPRTLLHRPDPNRPGFFQVVDGTGTVWADGVRNETAARVFEATPGLLLGYDGMLEEVFEYFHVRWNIGHCGPGFEEFVEDQGDLEDTYPGAPDHASWLQSLRERSESVKGPNGESPFNVEVHAQAELY